MGEYIKDQTLSTTASSGDFFVFDSATNTYKITRQNLLGQMDTNENNIATNSSNISDISDQVDANEIISNANQSGLATNNSKILALESEVNSRRIWTGLTTDSEINVYSKVGIISLSSLYSEYNINFDLIMKRDGVDATESMFIGTRQAAAFGSDPVLNLFQRSFSTSQFDLGVVIDSNSGPSLVSIWIKYKSAYSYPVLWLQSMVSDHGSSLTLITSTTTSTEPTGIEYATKQTIQTV